jgi:hypothetical protein
MYQPEWREAVLLYGGLLYNAGPRKVEALVRKVLDRGSAQFYFVLQSEQLPGLEALISSVATKIAAPIGPSAAKRAPVTAWACPRPAFSVRSAKD